MKRNSLVAAFILGVAFVAGISAIPQDGSTAGKDHYEEYLIVLEGDTEFVCPLGFVQTIPDPFPEYFTFYVECGNQFEDIFIVLVDYGDYTGGVLSLHTISPRSTGDLLFKTSFE